MMLHIATCTSSLIVTFFSAFLIVSGVGFSPLRSFVVIGGDNMIVTRSKQQHSSYIPPLPIRCHRMTKFDEEWGETKPKRQTLLERQWPKTATALGAIASLTASGLSTKMVVPGYVTVLLALWGSKRARSDGMERASFYSSNAISTFYGSNTKIDAPTITEEDDGDDDDDDDNKSESDKDDDSSKSDGDKDSDSKSDGGKPYTYIQKSQLDNYYSYGNKSNAGTITGTTKFGDYYNGSNLDKTGRSIQKGNIRSHVDKIDKSKLSKAEAQKVVTYYNVNNTDKPIPKNNIRSNVNKSDKPKLSKADAQKLVTYQSWISSQSQGGEEKEEAKEEEEGGSTPMEQEASEVPVPDVPTKVIPKLLIQKTKVEPPEKTLSTSKYNSRRTWPTKTALAAGSMAALARLGLASSISGPGYVAIVVVLWASKRTPSERSIRGGSGYYKKRIVKDVISGEPREMVSAWVSNRMDADARKLVDEEARLEKQRQWEAKEAAKAKKWVASTLKNTELLWSEVEERRKLEAFERKQAEMWVENASRGGSVSRGDAGENEEGITGEDEEDQPWSDEEGQPWSGGQWSP